jgi:hypothetical protein
MLVEMVYGGGGSMSRQWLSKALLHIPCPNLTQHSAELVCSSVIPGQSLQTSRNVHGSCDIDHSLQLSVKEEYFFCERYRLGPCNEAVMLSENQVNSALGRIGSLSSPLLCKSNDLLLRFLCNVAFSEPGTTEKTGSRCTGSSFQCGRHLVAV